EFFRRDVGHMIDLVKSNGNTGMVSAYTEWQHRFTDKVVLNTGIYFQDFLLNGSNSIEPRAGFNYKVGEHNQFSFGYGLHSQTVPLVVYFFDQFDSATNTYLRTNLNLGFMKAHHLIAGYDFNFAKNFRMKTEVYYQYLFNVPVKGNVNDSYSAINMGGDYGFPNVDSLVNKGTGSNYGAEFTLEKFFSKGYYFLVTTSLFDSKYRGSDDVLRNTKFNGRYVINVLGGYEFKFGKQKNQALSMDVRFTQAGGRRYTPIDLATSQLYNDEVRLETQAWSAQYRDYSRFDLKIGFRFNGKHTTQSIIAVCENVFGIKNILNQSYDTNTHQIRTEYQLGVFPYGAYRIEF
ncbi:MAG TPA: TonB-dependent receptor, partial [Bacteroidetes bacterium]|nr:TonB-dependent receptor [Bacteroidota bacterium]